MEKSFYVDNCTVSLTSEKEAKLLVDQLRNLLADEGFELRQWARNVPAVLCHFLSEARSDSAERWMDSQESARVL